MANEKAIEQLLGGNSSHHPGRAEGTIKLQEPDMYLDRISAMTIYIVESA